MSHNILTEYSQGRITVTTACKKILSEISQENVRRTLGDLPIEFVEFILKLESSTRWTGCSKTPSSKQIEIAQDFLSNT
jgi:hypothetical protein